MKNTMALRRAPGGEFVARLCPTKWRSRDAFADFLGHLRGGASWHCSRSGKHFFQGFEHVSKSSGAMKCYEFMGVSLLSSYFFVSNIREDITLVLVAWNMILFFHILGISSSQLTFTPSFFRRVGQPPTSTWYDQQHGIWMDLGLFG